MTGRVRSHSDFLLRCPTTRPDAGPQRSVVSSKVSNMIFPDRTRPVMLDQTQPASGHTTSPLYALRQCMSALTGHTLPASGRRAIQRPVMRPKRTSSAATDRTLWSNQGQRPVTHNDLCLFCLGRRWHRRTIRTLRADTPPVEFLTLAPKLHHP